MLLRSSSNPGFQTHFSDSPIRDFDTTNHNPKHSQLHDHCTPRLSLIYANHHQGHRHLNLRSLSSNLSPISHSPSGFSEFNPKPNNSLRHQSFRRAVSDGNLEGLASTNFELDEVCDSNPSRSSRRPHKSMLQSAPSFSVYHSSDGSEEDEKELEKEQLERSVAIGDNIEAMGTGEFSFGKKTMGLIDEIDEGEALNGFQKMGIEELARPVSPPMYIATGYDMEGNKGFGSSGFDEPISVEEHYRRMIAEDPNNPLFLRNYAQLLQFKGDLLGAEEFYLRATLADPQDGEIMLQYAKLVWELHRDQDRALSYFERAAHAAPKDSQVLAAFASFLWEIDEDEEEDSGKNDHLQIQENEGPVVVQNSAFEEEKVLGINSAGYGSTTRIDYSTVDSGKAGDFEEYFKRMLVENPCNPLFLRNYAQFLFQSKGDLRGAEEYYSRAILADPGDGETISKYAKLVWEIHHDRDKAASYFERSVQASPGDSDVCAAYASFLWETEEEEDEPNALQDQLLPTEALASVN